MEGADLFDSQSRTHPATHRVAAQAGRRPAYTTAARSVAAQAPHRVAAQAARSVAAQAPHRVAAQAPHRVAAQAGRRPAYTTAARSVAAQVPHRVAAQAPHRVAPRRLVSTLRTRSQRVANTHELVSEHRPGRWVQSALPHDFSSQGTLCTSPNDGRSGSDRSMKC